jgi:glycosidase
MPRLPKTVLGCLLLCGIALGASACDSTPQIATVTARAAGTNTINLTLTAALGGAAAPTQAPVNANGAAMTAGPAPTTNPPGAAATQAATQAAAPAPTQPPAQPATQAATTAATQAAGQPATATNTAAATATTAPTQAATVPATAPATAPATTEATKVAQAPVVGPPSATPFNVIMATVNAARTMTAAAPTATPATITIADTPNRWYRHMTLYSLFVRSFRDSNGDGIGDFQGVINGLDYIQSLGVDAIWLLPVFKSPSPEGYDISDYDNVQPDYGTNDDLIRLIKAVHKRGMHIFLDYVVNHTSSEHPFFKDAFGNPNSAYADYYIWGNAAHTQYATFAGVPSKPRLNYDSPKVVAFSTAIALHWLDPNGDGDPSDGFDGLRADVANNVSRAFWLQLRAAMTKLNPKSVLLAEMFVQTPQDMQGYLGDGRFDTAFDFPLYMQMAGNWDVNGTGVFSGKGNAALAYGLARSPQNFYLPGVTLVRFIGNHDTNRVMSNIGGDPLRAKAAALFLMTAPGPVVLYYGDEIGMQGSKCPVPDLDNCRREPLEWSADLKGPGQATWFMQNDKPGDGISIQEQDGKPRSLLTYYRALGVLRQAGPLQSDQWDMPEPAPGDADLYVLRRWDGNAMTVVVINFTAASVIWQPTNAILRVGADAYQFPVLQPALSGGVDIGNASWRLRPGGFAVFSLAR